MTPIQLTLRSRTATIRRALVAAGQQGMKAPEILPLLLDREPDLNRNTLAVWIADHRRQIQAVRANLTVPGGYTWYHRGAYQPPTAVTAPTPTPPQLAPRYSRAVTITLPTLPRITRLRVYAVAVTVYALGLTLLAVLR